MTLNNITDSLRALAIDYLSLSQTSSGLVSERESDDASAGWSISLFYGAFLRDVLGYEVMSIEPRDPQRIQHITGIAGAEVMVAYLRGAGHVLERFQYSGPDDRRHFRPRPCDVGFAHIAFVVNDVDAAVAACEAHGVRPIAAPIVIDRGPNKGNRIVYLRDDDGFTIEFIMRAKRSTVSVP